MGFVPIQTPHPHSTSPIRSTPAVTTLPTPPVTSHLSSNATTPPPHCPCLPPCHQTTTPIPLQPACCSPAACAARILPVPHSYCMCFMRTACVIPVCCSPATCAAFIMPVPHMYCMRAAKQRAWLARHIFSVCLSLIKRD